MSEITITRDFNDWNTICEALQERADGLKAGEEKRLNKFGDDFIGFASGGKAGEYARCLSLLEAIRPEMRRQDHEQYCAENGIDPSTLPECSVCTYPPGPDGCSNVDCPLPETSSASSDA